MKPLHVDQDKEEVNKGGRSHEERQLPGEADQQVKRVLLLFERSNVCNEKLVPRLNVVS